MSKRSVPDEVKIMAAFRALAPATREVVLNLVMAEYRPKTPRKAAKIKTAKAEKGAPPVV
jgi:hypothetical protein